MYEIANCERHDLAFNLYEGCPLCLEEKKVREMPPLAAVQRTPIMRKMETSAEPILRVADLELNTDRHSVHRAGKEIHLSRKEFMLLEYLMRNEGMVLSRDKMLENVWAINGDYETNTVDVHIRFLRRKIDDPFKKKLVKTVRGFGYKIEG